MTVDEITAVLEVVNEIMEAGPGRVLSDEDHAAVSQLLEFGLQASMEVQQLRSGIARMAVEQALQVGLGGGLPA